MNLSSAKASFGLNATATPTSTGVSGNFRIGDSNQSISFPTATVAYSLRAIFAGTDDALTLNMSQGSAGGTSWVAGVAQVETTAIVAAGGCTSNGTMTMVLTSTGMAGSPLNIPVALTTTAHTTADLIAAAAKSALIANSVVNARFTVSGSGANIVLTRKAETSFTVGSTIIPIITSATDASLNLAIPGGLGVTADSTSTDTNGATITDGVLIFDGDGLDFEGVDIPEIGALGFLFRSNSGALLNVTGNVNDVFTLYGNNVVLMTTGAGGFDATYTFTATDPADITITVVGGAP